VKASTISDHVVLEVCLRGNKHFRRKEKKFRYEASWDLVITQKYCLYSWIAFVVSSCCCLYSTRERGEGRMRCFFFDLS
jgi:hypothetical protein